MTDHNKPFDGDEELHKEIVHEENRKIEEQAKQHENQNPNLGKGRNPIHHDIGNK